MQKFEFYFNGKTYTSVSGLKSAQRAWIAKYLPGITGRLLNAPGGLYSAKIENYLPGIFRPEYMEENKLIYSCRIHRPFVFQDGKPDCAGLDNAPG